MIDWPTFIEKVGFPIAMAVLMATFIFADQRAKAKERERRDALDTQELKLRREDQERAFKIQEANTRAQNENSAAIKQLSGVMESLANHMKATDENYVAFARTFSERDEKHIEKIADVGGKVDALGGKVDIVGHTLPTLAKAVDGAAAITIDRADKTDIAIQDMSSKLISEANDTRSKIAEISAMLDNHEANAAKRGADTLMAISEVLTEVRRLAPKLAALEEKLKQPEVKQEITPNVANSN